MKQFVFGARLGAVVLALVLVTGCATNRDGTYKISISNYFRDEATPWQEQALLMALPMRDGAVGFANIVDANGRNIIRCQMDVGVVSAGTHTLYVYMEKYIGPIFNQRKIATSKPVEITYDFQPGGRYVLTGDLKTRLLGLAFDATVEIFALDEYQALPDASPADKGLKTEHVPKIFAQAEAELNN